MFNSLKQKNNVLTLLSIIGISFLLGITYWNSFNMPWERDEGEYAYSAWLLDQGIPPYENSFLQKPPMIIYTYWLAQKINPDALWPPRALSFISTIVTIYLLYLIAKKQFNKKAGLIAAWIGVPMLSLPHITALIVEKSNKDDKIFVAGSEPQIYYYSKRLSVNRFIITFALLIDTPLRDKHQQQAIDDLENNKPELIVYSQLPNNGLWEKGVPTTFIDYLNNLINTEYELIGGFVKDKDQYGHRQEPLTEQNQINSSSLLLFKKI